MTSRWFSHCWKKKWLFLLCIACFLIYIGLDNFRFAPPLNYDNIESREDMLLLLPEKYSNLGTESPTFSNYLQNFTALSKNLSLPLSRPSISQILPHLKDETSLEPAYLSTNGRTGVELVLGIPTVKRNKQDYLKVTLRQLLRTMTPADKNRTLIVILIAEADRHYVTRVFTEIQTVFSDDVGSGLIDIVSPRASYYPDFASLPRATGIGDDLKRFTWRSKQNLDYAFLMMYSQPKGRYYMQLEDDILSKTGFVPTILDYAAEQNRNNPEWIILEFCELGFIGKLFKSTDLAWLIEFFLIFFKDQPCDWLITRAIINKVCRFDERDDRCKSRIKQVWLSHPQSLFQHIGVVSSLEGKIQKLKSKGFGKVKLFTPHHNPEADSTTSIGDVMRGSHSIEDAYNGRDFFWGRAPRVADYIAIRFKQPVNLTRYHIQSGNLEQPSDQFYNTDVLVTPKSGATPIQIGSFDGDGVAFGTVPSEVNPIIELRLEVRKNHENYVILSEIFLETQN